MSRLGKISNWFLFRLIPALLLIGALWFGFQAAQSIFGVIGEQNAYTSRQPDYLQNATQMAIVPAPTATPDASSLRGNDMLVRWTSGDIDVSQFATNTPRPPAGEGETAPVFATNTPQGAVTESDAASATPMPPTPPAETFTPAPLPTILFLEGPSEAEIAAAPTAIPTAFPIIDRRGANLLNILLMGQDNEITGETYARTDTMIILSINRDTNTVAMLSLPRDLFVYIPGLGMNRLNTAFGYGKAVGRDFFFMRQVILYNFGINVHYYALVDLSGFEEIIDMVGGVEVAVDCPMQAPPLIGAEVPEEAIGDDENVFTLPVGYYDFTGKEALWYARARGNSDDFDRGRRQQQLILAGYRKARDSGMLSDVLGLPDLISRGLAAVETDLQLQDVLGLIPTALSLDFSRIENFRLTRTYHTTPWQPPDGVFVQLPVPDTLQQLLTDFYTPPTENRIASRRLNIQVMNGSGNAAWDRVAAERLAWDGYTAAAMGEADRSDYTSTTLIDYVGGDKGSERDEIVRILNVQPENIVVQPDPNRTVDFEVIVGADYRSCTGFVLEPE